jgi:alpha-tubulin suppressor-like RCC1 family protein
VRDLFRRTRSFVVLLAVMTTLFGMFVSSAQAQTIAGGLSHSVILKSDGTVWTVGADGSGQLGDDNTLANKKSPVQVSGLTDVVAVAAGDNHSMAITSTGALYLWGENANGQIGDNNAPTDR